MRLGASLLLLLYGLLQLRVATSKSLQASLQEIWQEEGEPLNQTDLEQLRLEAWTMFDHGFSGYMHHAFPKDNLLPTTCNGSDWQGGMALTLVDALDTLLLMNRREDMQEAVEQLREHVNFDKDIKVHVFETIIRVLGGLLSGHVLLARNASIVPDYDGLLLELAVDLADRMLPAFNTPSGLPALFVNLRKGQVNDTSITCTACAGTLLLEFGMLSALTGDPVYHDHAHRCAKAMYRKRSRLGLLGSSLDVNTHEWSSRETTIGPGSDSYYEYLLKAFLMFGDEEYLEMFLDLYTSAMRYLLPPSNIRGYSFLVDVHMDTGRVIKPFVSSLGAFWPGMQALAGQERDAVELHANFTAAWRTFGWMPELFGLDLSKVHPEDPGYNLRPEHVESTYMLHCLTGNPEYLDTARKMQQTLARHNRAQCGFASIANVHTGEHEDLQESFFLSETIKYLYFIFSNQTSFIDYYLLTTEGHVMPILAAATRTAVADDGGREEGKKGGQHSRGGSECGGGGEEEEEEEDEYLDPDDEDEEDEYEDPPDEEPGSGQEKAAAADSTAGSDSGSQDSGSSGEKRGGSGNSSSSTNSSSHVPAEAAPKMPSNCVALCSDPDIDEQVRVEASLRLSFPLLHFELTEAEMLRQRRCRACVEVTRRMRAMPPLSHAQRNSMMKLDAGALYATPPKVLAQVVCILASVKDVRRMACSQLRPISNHDLQHGAPANSVVLQLSLLESAEAQAQAAAAAHGGGAGTGAGEGEATDASYEALVVVTGGLGGRVSLALGAMAAEFSGPMAEFTEQCIGHLVDGGERQGEEAGAQKQGGGGAGARALHRRQQQEQQQKQQEAQQQEQQPRQRRQVAKRTVWSPGLAPAPPPPPPPLPSPDLAVCADLHQHCADWARKGECEANPLYMDTSCRLACQRCSPEPEGSQDSADGTGSSGASGATQAGEGGSAEPAAGAATLCEPMSFLDLLRYAPGTAKAPPSARLPQPFPALLAAGWGPAGSPAWACAPGDEAVWRERADAGGLPVAKGGSVSDDGVSGGPMPHVSGPCAGVPLTWAPLVEAEPLLGCSKLTNQRQVVDSIVVVARGGCSFIRKVLNMQEAGAVGVVVVNTQASASDADKGLLRMTADNAARQASIPAVLVSREAGQLMARALEQSQGSPRRVVAAVSYAPPETAPAPPPGTGSPGAAGQEGARHRGEGSKAGLRGDPHGEGGEQAGGVGGAAAGSEASIDGVAAAAAEEPGGQESKQQWQQQEGTGEGRQGSEGKQPQKKKQKPQKQPQQGQQQQQGNEQCPAGGNAEAQQPQVLTPRVDMLIPVTSQAFLQSAVHAKGVDIGTLFQMVLADGRVSAMLTSLAQDNLARQAAAQAAAQHARP